MVQNRTQSDVAIDVATQVQPANADLLNELFHLSSSTPVLDLQILAYEGHNEKKNQIIASYTGFLKTLFRKDIQEYKHMVIV